MPNSITVSGSGVRSSSAAVAQGINQSADIDALLTKCDLICNAINAISLQAATPIPQLWPIVTAVNASIETPTIAGIPGKSLIIRFSGWDDGMPIGGLIELVGSDSLGLLILLMVIRLPISILIYQLRTLGQAEGVAVSQALRQGCW